jgi:hypothetical protein
VGVAGTTVDVGVAATSVGVSVSGTSIGVDEGALSVSVKLRTTWVGAIGGLRHPTSFKATDVHSRAFFAITT